MPFRLNANQMMDTLVDQGIATEEELSLVSSIIGHNRETYEKVLFARTGYRSFEQLNDEDELDDDDELEDEEE